MNVREYCDILNLNLIICRYCNQNERWSAHFEYCEIKTGSESGILSSSYGDGKTAIDAIINYLEKIEGNLLVVHAGSADMRREYIVPLGIEV